MLSLPYIRFLWRDKLLLRHTLWCQPTFEHKSVQHLITPIISKLFQDELPGGHPFNRWNESSLFHRCNYKNHSFIFGPLNKNGTASNGTFSKACEKIKAHFSFWSSILRLIVLCSAKSNHLSVDSFVLSHPQLPSWPSQSRQQDHLCFIFSSGFSNKANTAFR